MVRSVFGSNSEASSGDSSPSDDDRDEVIAAIDRLPAAEIFLKSNDHADICTLTENTFETSDVVGEYDQI